MIAVLGPFLLVVGIVVGFIWWDRGAPPGFRPTLHDVEIAAITRDHRGVRVRGTAHYEIQLKEKRREGSAAHEKPFLLFPLFPKGDTSGREIRVMIRSQRAPDELYAYEDVLVEGLAQPPGRTVGKSARDALQLKGYMFADDFVLIEAFDVQSL